MAVKTVAHLNFRGEARAALSFYQSVFGGELAAVTHAQVYGTKDPVEADLVSWGQVGSPEGFAIMAFDVPSAMEWDAGKIPFFVSIRADNEAELARYWAGLEEGATVIQPLAGSTWAKLYGMLKDRFGVTWVLDVPAYSD
jgi:PhnB protein